jgi:NADPH:quinone reductase-like Zn-dependent oxidoreductase
MKAIIWTEYGGPEGLKLQEVEKPKPRQNEILIRIHAASVTAGDCEIRRLELPLMLSFPIRLYAGLRRPQRIRILGQELAGVVEEVGPDVSSYTPGDRVFGTTGFSFGAYAEHICLPANPGDAEGVLAIMPDKTSFEEAAVLPTAALEALHYLRKGNIAPGMKVLIIGGGGSIGTCAIQLAKHFQADVTAVDAPGKLDLMRSLGADRVIDYTKEALPPERNSYHIIIDVVGRKNIPQRLALLKPGGIYFLAFARLRDILLGLWTSLVSDKKLSLDTAPQIRKNLEYLAELIDQGSLTPVIDRTFPLEQVSEAHRYAESGKKAGNLAVRVIP